MAKKKDIDVQCVKCKKVVDIRLAGLNKREDWVCVKCLKKRFTKDEWKAIQNQALIEVYDKLYRDVPRADGTRIR